MKKRKVVRKKEKEKNMLREERKEEKECGRERGSVLRFSVFVLAFH
jgi:hypothetical protein